MYWINFFSFLLTFTFGFTQVTTHIAWLSDSIALGMPTELAFSVRYPVGYAIIFPDSAKDFQPFELHSKRIFPTKIENNYAIDSVVYSIKTFQIDSLQKIQLKFGYVYQLDTTFSKSEIVKIPFQRKVFYFDEKTPYLYSKELYDIPVQPNYSLVIGFFLGILVLMIIVFYLFRGKIIEWLLFLKMKKEWKSIKNQIDKIFTKQDLKSLIYELNLLWKSYLGSQKSIRPESLTSKEFQAWIDTVPGLDNKKLFIELCQLEEIIFYTSEPVDKSVLLGKKESILSELEKVYLYKKKNFKNFSHQS